MKLAILKNDEGLVNLFRRLLESKAEEIVIFDPCSNPAKSDTDIYFYFPCSNVKHDNCGFFAWVVSINTAAILYADIEAVRRQQNLVEKEVLALTDDENFRAFNIIVTQSFTNTEIIGMIRKWLTEWVQELSHISIRSADILEYQKTFAMYEECHLDAESVDLFYHEQRGMITNEFYFRGKMLSKSEYDQAIKNIIDERLGEEDV